MTTIKKHDLIMYCNENPELSPPKRGHLTLVTESFRPKAKAKTKKTAKRKVVAHNYEDYYASMDAISLMEEMVRFQEERSMIGELTPSLINRGIPLFTAISQQCKTQELRLLSTSYLRHLQLEIKRSG